MNVRASIVHTCGFLLLGVVILVGSILTAATPPDEAQLQKAANLAIAHFQSQLQTSLKLALDEGGPLNAIGVCNVVAPEIQVAHVKDGFFIERVTDRPRNRNNQADSLQLTVLRRFRDSSAPEFYAAWDDTVTRGKYHFYKPIRIAEVCLGCHGDAAKLSVAVKDTLAALYPADKAVGYQPGDLRGMFVVEILLPEASDYVKKLSLEKK